MKTFRFGVNVGPSRSRTEGLEKTRKLEDLGYATRCRDGSSPPGGRGIGEPLDSVESRRDPPEPPSVLIGTVDEQIEDLHARRERWGISYYVIFEPYVDAFAPVVARLAGGLD
jgi:hypothetical protein